MIYDLIIMMALVQRKKENKKDAGGRCVCVSVSVHPMLYNAVVSL